MLVCSVVLSAVVPGAGSKPEAPLPIAGEIGSTSCSCCACAAAQQVCLFHHLKGWACPLCFGQCGYPWIIIFNCVSSEQDASLCNWMKPDNCGVTDMRLYSLNSATSELYFCLFLQAVETNLASKDSHWVYANEVRPDTNSHKYRGKLVACCLKFASHLFLFYVEYLGNWAFIQYFITVCLLGSVHLFFSVAPPVTLTSSDPNCTNEEFDEFADHFLLLMVDINAITHSDLLIFLDILKKKKHIILMLSKPRDEDQSWLIPTSNK